VADASRAIGEAERTAGSGRLDSALPAMASLAVEYEHRQVRSLASFSPGGQPMLDEDASFAR
jgi:hypothetical protein